MTSRLIFSLSVFALLSVKLSASHASEDPSLVVVFGDSITYGYAARGRGDGDENVGAPDIELAKLLNDSDRPSIVPNLGWGGTPSGPAGDPGLVGFGNGLERIDGDLNAVLARYPDHQGRYIAFLYGFNDEAYGIPSSTTAFNLRQMMRNADSKGFTSLMGTILGCQCSNTSIPGRNSSIRSMVTSEANMGRDVYLVDQYNLTLSNLNTYLSSDGVHPSSAGYQAVAQNWFDERLASLIEPLKKPITGALYLLLLDDDDEE